ncbi:hypothetical protein [Cupriavidus sp. YAF13]|uniref:hypothetical protein n=1 Tax=Cupriavidus sp. YAF13 TaxID=3233075 RepID=UPI003F91FA53
MMEDLSRGTLPAPQAQALANILAITRREWQVAGLGHLAVDRGRPRGCRDQLTQRAARAFEAQVMALRCRQAVVL